MSLDHQGHFLFRFAEDASELAAHQVSQLVHEWVLLLDQVDQGADLLLEMVQRLSVEHPLLQAG